MKSLYRKYRPLKLSEVVGQEQVTTLLSNSLKQGKISHAYLFVGPRGCGKTSVARILAHEVNGFEYTVEDNYVDIIEIDGASNRGIDNIRELREKALIAPTSGKYKIYIIDEVHMLTKEAFNALLKILEEPPKHIIFIMATTDAYKVPVTITSRAQIYTFKLANPKIMFDFLKKITEKEKIKISDEALKIIVKRGGGSFRDSLSLLDQISTLSNSEITKDLVISAMGLAQDEKIDELLIAYSSKNVVKITTLLKDILSSGVKPETLTEELILKIISDPKPVFLPLLAKLPEVKAPFAEAKLLVYLAEDYSAKTPTLEQKSEPKRKESFPSAIKEIHENIINFDWESFIEKVRRANEAVYSQLIKTKYKIFRDELHLYPQKKIERSILTRDNNKKILVEAGNGIKIIIHEDFELSKNIKNDEMLAKISDIMGGEVVKDGGGDPFEK